MTSTNQYHLSFPLKARLAAPGAWCLAHCYLIADVTNWRSEQFSAEETDLLLSEVKTHE